MKRITDSLLCPKLHTRYQKRTANPRGKKSLLLYIPDLGWPILSKGFHFLPLQKSNETLIQMVTTNNKDYSSGNYLPNRMSLFLVNILFLGADKGYKKVTNLSPWN